LQRQNDIEHSYDTDDIGWDLLEDINTQLLRDGVSKKKIEIRHTPDAEACRGEKDRPGEAVQFFLGSEIIYNHEVNSEIFD
jgi:hypothetical protein